MLFVEHFKKPKKIKGGWKALCPAHNDKDQSLSITETDEKYLLHCHAGCQTEDIVAAVGLKMSDLFKSPLSKKSNIIAEYKYENEKGEYLFSVCRMHPKNFRQRTRAGWGLRGLTPVLYRLPEILKAKSENKPVYVVEGEKDVHTLESLGKVATTAPMGAGKWREEYSQSLKNADVILVPDNDAPGKAHAEQIFKSLSGLAKSIKVIWLKDVKDVSDFKGDFSSLVPVPYRAPELEDDLPFDVLGYINPPHQLVYRRRDNCEIIFLGYNSHKKENLLQLAPYSYWLQLSGGQKIDPILMQDMLSTIAHKKGRFHPNKIRGYGAWIDNGRPVYNDGETISGRSIKEFDTKYFYRKDHPVLNKSKKQNDNGVKSTFEKLGFSDGEKIMIGGWCCLAPICGALRWRPHIWITADHGSGKSVILERIVGPVVGKHLAPTSNTTEAGIRQALDNNSVPIVFDEAEGKTPTSFQNMLKILELARKSSGNTNSITYKGTTSGKAYSYVIQSMFCFASINPPITEQSDESRISILNYNRLNAEAWADLDLAIHQNITEEKCNALRFRTIKNMKTILKSVDVVFKEINAQAGNARFADQFSPLIAGWWHLDHDDLVPREKARELIDKTFEGKNASRIEAIFESDCSRCLDDIMTMGIPSGGGQIKPIRLLINNWIKSFDTDDSVKTILNSYGITVSRDLTFVMIHEFNTEFRRLLSKTSWAGGIGKIVSRLQGVETGYKTSINFKRCSVVKIPVYHIFER